MRNKIYSLSCLLIASLTILSACSREKSIKIYPQAVTVDSNAQDILFYTNRPYLGVGVRSETTDFQEVSENITDETSTIGNSWFRLEWKSGSNGIKLHLEENKTKEDRQLLFSAELRIQGVDVIVTQSGVRAQE